MLSSLLPPPRSGRSSCQVSCRFTHPLVLLLDQRQISCRFAPAGISTTIPPGFVLPSRRPPRPSQAGFPRLLPGPQTAKALRQRPSTAFSTAPGPSPLHTPPSHRVTRQPDGVRRSESRAAGRFQPRPPPSPRPRPTAAVTCFTARISRLLRARFATNKGSESSSANRSRKPRLYIIHIMRPTQSFGFISVVG